MRALPWAAEFVKGRLQAFRWTAGCLSLICRGLGLEQPENVRVCGAGSMSGGPGMYVNTFCRLGWLGSW